MQRIASRIIWPVNLLFLSFLPTFAFAGNSAPEDYATGKQLMLEVRYCECQATKIDSVSSDLLPSFLEDSDLLKVSVSRQDKGFASSSELSIGYEVKTIAGPSDQFQFNYAGSYTTSNGNSTGNGELLLVQGQWVTLFGSRHDSQTGSQ
ncbi:MAG: hypothetical protein WD623_12105 [Marinobacter sp.]|uniref:hypothetical protein n=1 Tax=Marinobacter sp. TaxID=50741 RepID=UPI0034A07E42